MTFDEAKQRKFDLGRSQYPNSAWSADQVDARKEAMDELCDLWWYAELLADPIKERIQLFCRDTWTELQQARL